MAYGRYRRRRFFRRRYPRRGRRFRRRRYRKPTRRYKSRRFRRYRRMPRANQGSFSFKSVSTSAIGVASGGYFQTHALRIGDMPYVSANLSKFRWFKVSSIKVEILPLQSVSFALDITAANNQYTGPKMPLRIGVYRTTSEAIPSVESRENWNRKMVTSSTNRYTKLIFTPNTATGINYEGTSGTVVSKKEYNQWYTSRNEGSPALFNSIYYYGYWVEIPQWDTWFGTNEWEGGNIRLLTRVTVYYQGRQLDISNIVS